ncbi:ABC transporter permease [Clostridium beijerinckii]|uniref:ABC transport system permease protein n=1 Tax=Clostridium beijerinckii TaxID=1520 RepID=A0AAE5LPE1_CLOBE|nr:ABC transporter permease [Clostridium beijerinckii]NRT92133.1 putative ABC transport system permease protein [Clostridium beijerinckii]NSB13609.1 putative ABC transport system permease protein [Clostridium beijerinckii]NYC71661.1 putative ABC transport system permease protein [Clostridium beijerinckii]OOM20549.1 FtsX-like permease family protein [Clostridium beijerinckii]
MKMFLKELFIKPINTIFICLGFTIAIYCLSAGTCLFTTFYNLYNDKNYVLKESCSAEFKFKENTSLGNFVDIIEKRDSDVGFMTPRFDLEIEKNRTAYLIGIYNYKDLDKIFPLKEGRFFTKEESISNKKIALVGSNLADLIYMKNDKKYIKIEGEEFEVVGLIGRKTLSYWGLRIFIPVNSLPNDIYNSDYESIGLYYPKDMLKQKNYFYDLKSNSSDKNIESIKVNELSEEEGIASRVFSNNKPIYISLLFSILLAVISILIFSTFWADSLKKNIAIKKILGADNLYIFKQLIYQMLILITFSSIIAGILNIMTLNFLETLVAGNISFDLINIINISIATFTLTILNSLWIYKDILKFNVLKHIR